MNLPPFCDGLREQGIVATEPTPFTRALAFRLPEDPGEMALVDETASESNLCQFKRTLQQEFLRALDTSIDQPSMGRHSGCLAKGAGEMAGRQAAFPREVRNRGITVEMSVDETVNPPKLPGRKSPASRAFGSEEVAVGTYNVCMERQCDRIDEKGRRRRWLLNQA